jgi:hypothetical protein
MDTSRIKRLVVTQEIVSCSKCCSSMAFLLSSMLQKTFTDVKNIHIIYIYTQVLYTASNGPLKPWKMSYRKIQYCCYN